ncbi:MAG: glycosyl hydrolase [Candidatus Bathyarchaeia archaeon]
MERIIEGEFQNPGKEFRPSPFWSLNDELFDDELAWQIREMKEKGFGGYFMHSRVGLVTKYLSREWMLRLRTCLEEGKRADMEAWLYDEDKWPSGFAGGLVPARSEEYRAKGLEAFEVSADDLEDTKKDRFLLAVFSVLVDERGVIKDMAQVYPKGERAVDGGRLLAFRVTIAGRSNWYNGESYVDLLDPRATEAFLQETHDAYAREFGSDFGEHMPGIFTDEPNFVAVGDIPWTSNFDKYFEEVNGYSVVEKLPLLYFRGNGYEKVRHDYWKTVTRRFIEAFTRPFSERCERYGLKFTGHYLAEDNLYSQVRAIGAAMPHYEFMHVPGIDHLGRNIRDPLTLKQVSSVAHQLGRNRIMCEIFGVSGHSMTFEDQKWIADFHFVLGITFLVPHLTLYSMRSDGKRDYPPTFSYHQPYWDYERQVNDYFARCSYVLSQGRFVADVLLLHPVSSAWAYFSASMRGEDAERKNVEVSRLNSELCYLVECLLEGHRDFDLGDEVIIERHGRIDGDMFVVGGQRYKLVVVPPSLTWSTSTLRLLRDFVNNGGRVLFVGQMPTHVDGEPSEAWEDFAKASNVRFVLNLKDTVIATIDGMLERDVSIVDKDENEISEIYYHHRVVNGMHVFFMSNKNRFNTIGAKIRLKCKGSLSEWDPVDGKIRRIEHTTKGDYTELRVIFPPVGSHIFVVSTPESTDYGLGKLEHKACRVVETIPIHGDWRLKRKQPNSLTLDYCRYSVEDSEWSEVVPVWKARLAVVEASGMREFLGIQPWALIDKGIRPKQLKVKLRFEFHVEKLPRSARIVVERIWLFELLVNEHLVSTKTSEWHWDKQFGMVDVTQHLIKGLNRVELSCTYNIGTNIEEIYLVGDFGVRRFGTREYVISDEPSWLNDGSWTDQGYPFYSGNMVYEKTIKINKADGRLYSLRLKNPKGTLFRLFMNGKEAGFIWKQPLELDVTGLVEDGENLIQVEVVGSLRNTFGPLHHDLGDRLPWTGPWEFVDEAHWTDQYQFAPYGLLNGAEVVIGSRDVEEP